VNQAADALERFEDAISRILADALLKEIAASSGGVEHVERHMLLAPDRRGENRGNSAPKNAKPRLADQAGRGIAESCNGKAT